MINQIKSFLKNILAKFNANNPKHYFYLGLVILTFPYLFWIYLGENSYVVVFDNLDHEFIFIKQLIESGNVLGFRLDENIIGSMNGIPRAFYRTGLSFTFVLFSVFPDIYAYIIQHYIVHLIGFVGMFFLMKRYFIKDNNLLIFLIAICWGFLDYHHIQYGISISGQPILLFAFLNLLHRDSKWYNWVIICLFPFCSFMPFTLPFFIPILVLIAVRHYIYVDKRISYPFIIGIISIFCINLAIEFPLVYQKFFSDLVSHRTINTLRYFEIDITKKSIFGIIYETIRRIYLFGTFESTKGMQHLGNIQIKFILIAFLSLLYNKKFLRKTLPLVVLIVGIVLWDFLGASTLKAIGVINDFSFRVNRASFLLSFLWILLLVMILKELSWKNAFNKNFSIVIISFIFFFIVFDNGKNGGELVTNIKKTIRKNSDSNLPTFKQYYSTHLYDKVKEYVGDDEIKKYNFLVVGLFPNVAHYNGIKTLGAYQNNYLLSYKKEYKKIIQPELDKNPYFTHVFEDYGHTCFIPYLIEKKRSEILKKTNENKIEKLDLNLEQAKKMGGKYLVSYVPIENYHNHPEVKFHRTFETENSFYKLFLYELL